MFADLNADIYKALMIPAFQVGKSEALARAEEKRMLLGEPLTVYGKSPAAEALEGLTIDSLIKAKRMLKENDTRYMGFPVRPRCGCGDPFCSTNSR